MKNIFQEVFQDSKPVITGPCELNLKNKFLRQHKQKYKNLIFRAGIWKPRQGPIA